MKPSGPEEDLFMRPDDTHMSAYLCAFREHANRRSLCVQLNESPPGRPMELRV